MKRMIKIWALAVGLITLHSNCVNEQERKQKIIFNGENYKQLLIAIRDGKISPDSAKKTFQAILKNLKSIYPNTNYDSSRVSLVFPLRQYNWRVIGGKNGSGYFPRHFDLFDINKKTSHPAHDLFIRDRNQDAIDDNKGTYIDVLSVADGVVLATETNWQPNDIYRGGNYIWIYDTQQGGLWYYAHQREVFVTPGQSIKAGEKIGEVGRTGHNAYQKRSETHLHLTYLKIDEDFLPHPVNTFLWLKNAQTLQEASPPKP